MFLSNNHKKNQMGDITLFHQPYCTVKDTLLFFPEDSGKGNLLRFQKFQQSKYKEKVLPFENYSLNYQISDARKE